VLPPVVDVSWLREHRGEVVLADVRWYLDGRSGRAAYDAGHLPGAVFVDLDHALAALAGPGTGRHPLPEPEAFAAGMAALGIGDDDTVVAYDDAGGLVAARLAWLLRVTGHDAALLDGGTAAWDGPLEQAVPERAPAVFTPRPWPEDRLAGVDDVLDPAAVVLDARDPERYRGSGSRSTRAPATCPARSTYPPAATSAPTAASCRSSSCARPSPRPGSPPTATWWPTAAPG
jgi:thiosulfate/3-mercaptopyruvate sulfurtransferase